jgi:NAD kinase
MIKLAGKQSGVVVIDGEYRMEVSAENEIKYSLSSDQTYLVKLEEDFYELLR